MTFEWKTAALSISTWCKVCLPGHEVIERGVIEPSSIEEKEQAQREHVPISSLEMKRIE